MAIMQILGILGNLSSLAVYLAPMATFREIHVAGSTDGHSPAVYLVLLFLTATRLYWAVLRPHTTLLIVVNAIGCAFQMVYITMFIYYSNNNRRVCIFKVLGVITTVFGLVVLLTMILLSGTPMRWVVVSWIALLFAPLVFIAPLFSGNIANISIPLAASLTLNGGIWAVYGFLDGDMSVAIPNLGGSVAGAGQLAYAIYLRFQQPEPEPQQELAAAAQDSQPEL